MEREIYSKLWRVNYSYLPFTSVCFIYSLDLEFTLLYTRLFSIYFVPYIFPTISKVVNKKKCLLMFIGCSLSFTKCLFIAIITLNFGGDGASSILIVHKR